MWNFCLFTRYFLCLLFVYLCVLALIQYAGITSIHTAEYQLLQSQYFVSKTVLKYSICIREVHYTTQNILIMQKNSDMEEKKKTLRYEN
jgi:uncharacterized membrane protein (Fun14 family)